jgi:hypothetical protein
MWAKRVKDLFAAFVLGNGLLDLIAPRQRLLLWLIGPEELRKVILWFADHPTVYRLRGVARVGIGIWLALRQYEELKRELAEAELAEARHPWWRMLFGG